jgi:signal transduction histidine kinase
MKPVHLPDRQGMTLGTDVDRDRQAVELAALSEVAKALVAPLDLAELLEAVLGTIGRVLEQAELGAIMLWDQPTGLFRAATAFGYNLPILKQLGLRGGEAITGKVFDAGTARLLATPDEVAAAMADLRPFNRDILERALDSSPIPCSAVAAPIAVAQHRYGVLILESRTPTTPFTSAHLPFVQLLADLLALAIDRERWMQRADAVREARRAERTRSEVLATLSHELRMPLSSIKGYATALLLEDLGWTETKRREFLQLIEVACDDMEVMIRDILDASLIDVDQLRVERRPLALPPLAREAADEVQTRSRRHRVMVDFPAGFPVIEADPYWTKQVLRNILDNAVKYSPDGGLIVVRGEPRPSDVVVSVADQGIGISSEDVVPLFERYFRASAATQLHIGGTGLGLPIARSLLEAQGGRIWVESKLGEGTTVFFSLPRADLGLEEET